MVFSLISHPLHVDFLVLILLIAAILGAPPPTLPQLPQTASSNGSIYLPPPTPPLLDHHHRLPTATTVTPLTSGEGLLRQYRDRESMALYEKMCSEIQDAFQAVLKNTAESMARQQQQQQQQIHVFHDINNSTAAQRQKCFPHQRQSSPISPISPPPVHNLVNPAGGQSQLALWRQSKLNQAFQQAMSPIAPPLQMRGRGRGLPTHGGRTPLPSPISPLMTNSMYTPPFNSSNVFNATVEPAWARQISPGGGPLGGSQMLDINCNGTK